jgi:hypothetical protein
VGATAILLVGPLYPALTSRPAGGTNITVSQRKTPTPGTNESGIRQERLSDCNIPSKSRRPTVDA